MFEKAFAFIAIVVVAAGGMLGIVSIHVFDAREIERLTREAKNLREENDAWRDAFRQLGKPSPLPKPRPGSAGQIGAGGP